MPEQALPDRQVILRSAFARFVNSERLRLMSFAHDALEREGHIGGVTGEEADELSLALATGCLPWGGPVPAGKEPRPTRTVSGGKDTSGLDLDPW